ncbi:MAG: hypothetical protein IPK85_02695 [Gemmatimonadetes bacterium]|nr:hypothetical protein [Gemmatimonadota bacterium]
MQSLSRFTEYAPSVVLRALRGSKSLREWRFRYELLTRDNIRIRDLDNVVGGSVAHEFLAETKRTAKFVIQDDGTINFLNQRVRPWAGVKMPDGGYMEWPLWRVRARRRLPAR